MIPALVARRIAERRRPSTTRSAPRSPSSRARWASARRPPPRPTGCCSRCAGSGQALYVGLAEDALVVASEPYGLVEETADLPADGRRDPGRSRARRGDPRPGRGARRRRTRARSRASGASRSTARRCRSRADELQHAEITTRDIDRGDFPHFLLKEISEAPASFRKTLRGKVVERDGRLGGRARPRDAARRRSAPGCATARIRRVVVIGQGTAAVAGQSLAAVLAGARRRPRCAPRRSSPPSSPASSSATTCPTRSSSRSARAAPPPTPTAPSTSRAPVARAVVAIVNRRNSDLVDKSDGVLYTSDGRDVEMAVPSTKAFYAQIAAGYLLALAHRRRGRRRSIRRAAHELLDVAARAARRDARACSRSATRSPRSRSGTRCRGATGRSSATAATASPRTRCGSSSRSSATSRSRATSTEDKKHIDLSRRAADPRVRGRARRARTPTTSPRRSRSTARTAPRRS